MKPPAHDPPRGDCLSPTDMAVLKYPLEFIHEDHLREREICAILDQIADQRPVEPAAVSRAMDFLSCELPLHLLDEEEDLFPLLGKRCKPEDEIDKTIQHLCNDHGCSNDDTPKVIAILKTFEDSSGNLTQDDRAFLSSYAAHARRHLILENAIILPFARLRLGEEDLDSLRCSMARRRGIDPQQGI